MTNTANTRIVFKYGLKLGPNEMILPMDFKLSRFALDPKSDQFCLWVDQSARPDLEHLYLFDVIVTGQEYDADRWELVATDIDPKGFVAHLLREKLGHSGKDLTTGRDQYVSRLSS